MLFKPHFERLKAAREAAGISRRALAYEVGRSTSWVVDVEHGASAPSRTDAEKVAAILDTDAEQLFARIRD